MQREAILIFITIILLSNVGSAKCAFDISTSQIDLGNIIEGSRNNVEIKIINTGDEKIELNCKGSCSCLKTIITDPNLLARQETRLKLEIVRNRPGRFKEEILIQTKNDICKPKILEISGFTQKAFRFQASWQGVNKNPIKDKNTMFELSKMPEIYNTNSKLVLRLNSLLSGNKFIDRENIRVRSSLFRNLEKRFYKTANSQNNIDFVLEFKKELGSGLYQDAIIIDIGKKMTLTKKISFRVLGNIWSEKSAVSFGKVKQGSHREKQVKIHFSPSTKLWEKAIISKVEPETFRDMIRISDQKIIDNSVLLELRFDSSSDFDLKKSNGFFNFNIILSSAKENGIRPFNKKPETVKLYLYGMLVD